MIAVILQPGYLPWLGFFDLIEKADVFVIFDDIQFTIRDWRTRNRIRTNQGWKWLSVPVTLKKPYYEYNLKEIQISYDNNWVDKHLNSLKAFYGKAKFFNEVYPLIEKHLNKKYDLLLDLDNGILLELSKYLNIDLDKFRYSSEFNIPKDKKKSNRLISVIKELNMPIHTYLSGNAGKAFIDYELFHQNSLKVAWHDYEHPYYNQNLWDSNIFIPFLSSVDILFHYGKDSLDIITNKKRIEKPDNILTIAADNITEGKLNNK